MINLMRIKAVGSILWTASIIAIAVGLLVMFTWNHWWWKVPCAFLGDEGNLYLSSDGRYMVNLVDTKSAINQDRFCYLLKRGDGEVYVCAGNRTGKFETGQDFIILPFAAFSKNIVPVASPMNSSKIEIDSDLVFRSKRFSFITMYGNRITGNL